MEAKSVTQQVEQSHHLLVEALCGLGLAQALQLFLGAAMACRGVVGVFDDVDIAQMTEQIP